jgi:hypothetical protein
MLEGLHINVLADLSVDSYFDRIRRCMAERRTQMQSRQPLNELSNATALAAQRNDEWLGAFPKERQRPRR